MKISKQQYPVKVRRETLLQKMLEGNSNANIKTWWLQSFKLTEHTYEKDVTWCYNRLSLFVKDNQSELITNHLLRYDRNAEAAYELGQIGASTQALQAKEKLLGMHKPESQTFIQQNTLSVEHLTDEQIDRILTEAKQIKE